MQHLRHVKFIHSEAQGEIVDDGHYYNFALLENLNLIHQLPNLESVRIEAMEPVNRNEYRAEEIVDEQPIGPHSSNISKIHIGFSHVGSRYLERLINVSRRLTEFTYSTGSLPEFYLAHPDQALCVWAPKTLERALLSHRHSLGVLDLDVADALVDFDAEDPPLSPRPSPSGQDHGTECDISIEIHTDTTGILVHFRALTRLSLSLQLFFYFTMGIGRMSAGEQDRDQSYSPLIESLPPSLEYLCLRGYHPGLNEKHDLQLADLMAAFREARLLPKLKEVCGVEEHVPSMQPFTGQGEEHWSRRDDEGESHNNINNEEE